MTTFRGLKWQRLTGGLSRARMNVQDWQPVKLRSTSAKELSHHRWTGRPKGEVLICAPMSAFGYKRTYSGQLANVRFTPRSGHWPSPRQHELDQPIVVGGLHQIRRKVTATSYLDHP